ncbi:hypothetical protein AAA420_12605 [Lactobacillus crispatus]
MKNNEKTKATITIVVITVVILALFLTFSNLSLIFNFFMGVVRYFYDYC